MGIKYGFWWQAEPELTLMLDAREISSAGFFSSGEARGLLHEAHRVFVDRLLITIRDG